MSGITNVGGNGGTATIASLDTSKDLEGTKKEASKQEANTSSHKAEHSEGNEASDAGKKANSWDHSELARDVKAFEEAMEASRREGSTLFRDLA